MCSVIFCFLLRLLKRNCIFAIPFYFKTCFLIATVNYLLYTLFLFLVYTDLILFACVRIKGFDTPSACVDWLCRPSICIQCSGVFSECQVAY